MTKKKDKTILYDEMSIYENLEYANGIINVAGIDEAGRGPLAGPVVAGACILDPNYKILGLNDSKKLSASAREKLYEEITTYALAWSVSIIEHDLIDEINILEATKKAMIDCADKLSVKPDTLLIDAVNLNYTKSKVVPIIKGDTLSVSIAAASILAKVTRDRIMIDFSKIYPEYGFQSHKGYGTKAHYEAIERCGICPIHRKTFLKKILL